LDAGDLLLTQLRRTSLPAVTLNITRRHAMHALTRALTAVLVVLAVAAPVASARPIDPPGLTPAERAQDLRHLAAGGLTDTSAAPKGVYWSYEYEAPTPAPVVHSTGHATAADDDDIPWLTVGLIAAGTALLIGGALVLTTRRRPPTAHAV
jgi:hypothetical protein